MTDLGPLVPAPQPQNPRTAQLAGLGQRLLGRIIDHVALTAPILIWMYLLLEPGASASDEAMTIYLLVLAFSFANDVALTTLTGRSLGKMICGTRVARLADPRPITMGTAAIRWVVMVLLNVVPFGGLADALYIFSGEMKQTLHDKAAGTIVVRVDL
jgi:uncharacterized RDD family membrane protein YckC